MTIDTSALLNTACMRLACLMVSSHSLSPYIVDTLVDELTAIMRNITAHAALTTIASVYKPCHKYSVGGVIIAAADSIEKKSNMWIPTLCVKK